jgi:hypothetical protein
MPRRKSLSCKGLGIDPFDPEQAIMGAAQSLQNSLN